MEAIRWGIMGTGNIANLFAKGLSHVTDAKLVGVASRNAAKAKDFAQKYGIERSYDSYEQLTQADDIDVIFVATPATVHRDNALLCLHNRKHILCEKPFTINAKEAREVLDAAKSQQLFCMEAMWMRFLPAMQKAREIIDSGIIGDIRFLTADFGIAHSYDPEHRLFNRSLGGGALLDLGVYPVSLAYFMMGAPDHAVGEASMTPSGVDEQSTVILCYHGGAKAVCSSSLNVKTSQEAVINGTHGTLRIHAPVWRPSRLSIETFSPPQTVDTANPERLSKLRDNALVGRARQTFDGLVKPVLNNLRNGIGAPFVGNGYNYEAAEVNKCLKEGKLECPSMPWKDTLSIMSLLDDIRSKWGLRYPNDLNS